MNKPAFGFYGIFGFPLAHTLSPVMQEAAFKSAGVKAFYLPFEVRPGEFLALLKKRRHLLLDGFNVTVPYKETVLSCLDGIDSTAKAIGAVNTVVQKNGRWIGFNTDAAGFTLSLEKEIRFRIRGKRILILGAGGSARAVAYGLAKRGVRSITIVNRTPARAKKIVKDFRKLFPRVAWVVLKSENGSQGLSPGIVPDLVVNATSVGLRGGDRPLIRANSFPKKTVFADVIYKPVETALLRSARRSGHRTLNGTGMLLYQGAAAFRLWTKKEAPIKVMRTELKRALSGHD